MIEIIKAVSYYSQIIIIDEPTSSTTDKEADKLFEIISVLRLKGVDIVYISHKKKYMCKYL